MLMQNMDLCLLRYLIDLIEAERNHNAIQDSRISAIEQGGKEILQKLQNQQIELRNCQSVVSFLEAEIPHLRHQVARNAEIEYWANPYLQDGQAICNSIEVEDESER